MSRHRVLFEFRTLIAKPGRRSRRVFESQHSPFGGSKATGVGEREMAEEGLNFFTELKTVFINYSGKAERLMIR